ncbi:MAG TPA: bifunctional phosphoribosylaminoimidazolecarboxamide formyltransferase/IMP cyclohydrolase [Anaerohalosphaeraceae bacterium]|nr:bifunctional phosphoribosylaminoimidazolecarboxamide formyltransferase/IMP cyclohydrolase [Anaerohalosphaeraceae bacterium]HQG06198.1 bifunctional phosphoribosylaminoimidazolecarboxamide formyltransferase/IMP cyclohydrolase [Anaerohalosphaeraceae bacterium]HQI07691.1 bifunctional phosphoribosylaminoimidazolecarboxamide formyltransferase/IMP cyclohydrolase [Anaerohalosphaeraceae bacterium]HQJ67908.1 bifunctional phosphoribosylaminoimidazolecarboxamide formyltransferase/IMP cyclohydrolase [Anae
MDVKIQRALISVSDKTGVVDFARALSAMGVIIVSTGGTARTLEEAGIQVVPIDVVTGFPEMMDGRVKTLHPKIHGALLGLRDKADHAAAMKQHGIKPIDLVCVNLYPFEKTTARPDCTLEEAIENIDIGGPSMIRSAAKNYRFVTVVTSPQQYDRLLEAMRQNQGAVPLALREELARAVFSLTASYDAAIAKYLSIQAQDLFPERVSIAAARCQELRYGENPHQRGAFYRLTDSQEVGIGSAQLLEGGTPISFNNLMDANAAFELVKEFDEPAAVMVKHMNPCGCAVDENICTAYEKAYLGDVVSAFGGIAALNRPVDKELATVIMESYDRFGKARGAGGFFAEVIVAPSYTPEAVEVIRTLKAWGQRVRLLQTGPIDRTRRDTREYDIRCLVGGLLLQERDLAGWEPEQLAFPTKAKPTKEQMEDLRIAWLCAKHVKSNAITVVKDRKLVGVGAGQMNRVESGLIAFKHAGQETQGAAMGSDAFFPFPDNVENAAAAGIACIIQPGGSKKDGEVIAAADKAGIAMVFTGKRHFKH